MDDQPQTPLPSDPAAFSDQDKAFLDMAIAEASRAAERGEVPVGAVLVDAQGAVLARTGNRIVAMRDPTAHAELLAVREACAKLGNERLTGTTLYVSLEPCAMCAGALSLARVARLVFAAPDPKGGAVVHGPRFFAQATCHHRPDVAWGLEAERAGAQLKDFFRARRAKR